MLLNSNCYRSRRRSCSCITSGETAKTASKASVAKTAALGKVAETAKGEVMDGNWIIVSGIPKVLLYFLEIVLLFD